MDSAMKELTARQAEVLDLVRSHVNETGYPPTRAEIARVLGFKSPNAAEEHLKALARKGALEVVPGTSRGLRLPADEGLPVVGRVAAGSPEATNGAIVVARIDDDVTVKRFRRKSRSKVLLEAENRDYEPIEVDLKSQELVIEGLSVGVIRREP